MNKTEGRIFKIKRFSIHDGPGIRTSVFLKGCPLNCIWCHSPEGISSDNTIWYDRTICISCYKCIKVCPGNALVHLGGKVTGIGIIRGKCTLSGKCVDMCPSGALKFVGSTGNVSDIMDEIEKDIPYYKNSGGGITLTGGEPLFQPVFSKAILDECRRKGIHTTIETCLFADTETVRDISDSVDLFVVDLKIYDRADHIRFTGKSNEIIRENFRYLAGSGKNIIVRIPLIKNITDTEGNKEALTAFVHEIDEKIPVEYISYNPLAANNYQKLGIPFLLNL